MSFCIGWDKIEFWCVLLLLFELVPTSEHIDINKTWLMQVSGAVIRQSHREECETENIFPISQPKYIWCVLKTTVSMISFF